MIIKRMKLVKQFLTIGFVFYAFSLFAQSQNLSGVVSDASGPLVGVSVKVVGTSVGTITDINGKFNLTAPKEAKNLKYSYIGYIAKTLPIGNTKIFKVTLEEDTKMLDDVVVIGYGTMKKRDVTGAITSIDAKSIERRQPVTIFDALQGEASGVMVNSNSGAPGEASSIRIRGTSTFEAGVNPLYVVDGVPMDDITTINPSDIKSLEILKDAASSAIYGSRSANGVILISTKSGEEGKPKIEVRYLHTWGQLSRRIPQANTTERRIFENRAKVDLITEFTDSLGYATNSNVDAQEIMLQTANKDQLDFSFSGGTKQLKYLASIGFINESGIIITSFNKRLTGRFNADYQANKRLKLSSKANFSYQTTNKIDGVTAIQSALLRPAYFSLYYPDGSFIFDNAGRRNPVAELYYRENEYKTYTVGLYQMLEYDILKDLKFHADVNANFSLLRNTNFSSALLNTSTNPVASGKDKTTFSKSMAGNAYLSYNKKIKDHEITALLGSTIEDWTTDNMNFAGSQYVSESVRTMNSVQVLSLTETTTNGSSHSMAGFFARLGYNYKGRYLLNSTIRRDGSSRFVNNRWGTFPSLSMGWRLSDEKFMKWSKGFLDDTKIRASWGITGNENTDNYGSQSLYTFGTTYFNNISGVVTSSQYGNPDLKWEQTTQKNVGIDMSFLNSRLNLIVDYYDKTTDGLLYSSNVPSELGYSTMKVNLGSIQNKGVEITISGVPIKTDNFNWQTSINFSTNSNKILKLAGPDYLAGSSWLVAAGEPVGRFYGYNAMGVYQYDESNAWTSDYSTRLIPVFQRDANNNVILQKNGVRTLLGYTYPDGTNFGWEPVTNPVYKEKVGVTSASGGDMIWEDIDHNGVIDDKDRKVLGNGLPTWFGGWNNTFTYKNFSLSFSFYVNWGNKIYNGQKYQLTMYATANTTPQPFEILNAWRFQGQITPEPYAGRNGTMTNTNRALSSRFLEDGSYIRLNNLRFAYQLEKNICSKLKIEGLTTFLYGSNLLTWTNYSGYDPEIGGNSVLTPGLDLWGYPRRREIGFGLNLKL